MHDAADLPNDVEALKSLVLQERGALESAEALLISQKLELEKLRYEIACLKRMKYGRSSEQLDQQLRQMQLTLEDLEASLAAKPEHVRPVPKEPVEEITHAVACACPACGGALRPLGEDVSEMLEYVPGSYRVIRHIRPKLSCSQCQRIVQAPAPSRPIAKGLAGPGLLAHVLVSKYCDHLPLYRQSQIFRRERTGSEAQAPCLSPWSMPWVTT
jgi:transposase